MHFDVDCIDFTDAPLSENTGRNIGLTQDAAFAALAAVLLDSRVAALDDHGAESRSRREDGSTLTAFVDRLVAALAGVPGLARRGRMSAAPASTAARPIMGEPGSALPDPYAPRPSADQRQIA